MLCLPLELGLGDLDGYHGGQSFAQVLPAQVFLYAL